MEIYDAAIIAATPFVIGNTISYFRATTTLRNGIDTPNTIRDTYNHMNFLGQIALRPLTQVGACIALKRYKK